MLGESLEDLILNDYIIITLKYTIFINTSATYTQPAAQFPVPQYTTTAPVATGRRNAAELIRVAVSIDTYT